MTRLALAAALLLAPVPAQAETLAQAVAAACASNPTLAAATSRQQALAEEPDQAHAAGRLQASFDGSAGYDRFDYGKGVAGTVSAQLPIWTGGRVPAAVRAAKGDVAAGAEGLRDAEAGLLTDVVSAYAELLFEQQAVAIARADNELLDRQVAEAKARFNLGQATRTDVAQLEAQRASGEATLADAEAALATTTAAYRAIVGHDPGSLSPAPAAPAALPGTQDQARAQALAANPLFRQAQRAADASSARIDEARANGAPSLGVAAGYGYDQSLGRAGDGGYPRAASAGLVLHVPLLTGGLVASQVRAAKADHRADLFDAEAAAREAVRSADAAWIALANARARIAANRTRLAAADLALKGVRAEYGFDLRTTLDILVADESLRAAQLAAARSGSDALIAEAALLRATGRLGRDAFG